MNSTIIGRCVWKKHSGNLIIWRNYQALGMIYTNVNTRLYSKTNSNKYKSKVTSASLVEICKRLLSSSTDRPTKKLPPLMNFPEIVWPSLIKSFRNFILSTFIIKPYMDREFNIPEFVKGSKKAVEVHKLVY